MKPQDARTLLWSIVALIVLSVVFGSVVFVSRLRHSSSAITASLVHATSTNVSTIAREQVRSVVVREQDEGLRLLRAKRFAALAAAANASVSRDAKQRRIHLTAIYVDKAEFPLSKLLFRLVLRLALSSVRERLNKRNVELTMNLRAANTCARQFAGAVAAEEYYMRKSRLFIVSGCDDAVRGVGRLASVWRVPVMTGAGFGGDLSDKGVYKTLVRVAFSLRSAVEFLVKVLRTFQWRTINLIVDVSDPNSLALRESIEQHLLQVSETTNASNADNKTNFVTFVNTIQLDLRALQLLPGNYNNNTDDKWPNEATTDAVRQALKQSAAFSRVTILLFPQTQVRRFMLTAYDMHMANGHYTFITMPLLLQTVTDQIDDSVNAGMSNYSRSSYTVSSGDNVYLWRSLSSTTRNAHAKQAFESLMSIYLRTPTTRAYLYFASKVASLANTDYATTTTTTPKTLLTSGSNRSHVSNSKVQLSVSPYSASFYDCVQIYATLLEESLDASGSLTMGKQVGAEAGLHASISARVRNRRFENMLTGTVSINDLGDRQTDYTLDDMNQMTGKFRPVILYRGDTRDIERVSRIQWSSDVSIGPTMDGVECRLSGTCAARPISKFALVLLFVGVPIVSLMIAVAYVVLKRIRLESQLVDHWWRIDPSEIELVSTRRKQAACSDLAGSTSAVSVSGASMDDADTGTVSQAAMSALVPAQSGVMSSAQTVARLRGHGQSSVGASMAGSAMAFAAGSGDNGATKQNAGAAGAKTVSSSGVTKTTGADTSVAHSSYMPESSVAADVCYGSINLGLYKLNKVALKPIGKFHQSRKLMIDLRTIKAISHHNLCRFVGIVIEDACTHLVSEFCPKGSLREFFQNESMVIDWTFKYSIINDIQAGLAYLHSSPLGFHGRLRLSNCLVSARFVVKLSDYGLPALYEQLDSNATIGERDALMSKQLSLAPEHLGSSPKSVGSMKGDVYSFGLVLYEIITNKQPFYKHDTCEYVLPLKELLHELKHNGVDERTIGPDTTDILAEDNAKVESLVELMRQCWQYDAAKRPSSLVVGTALKKITCGVTSKKLLENLTSRMEQYTNNLESLVDAKLAALLEEKLTADELLYQFVPKSIATLLKQGQTVEPDAFECVTLFHSDIVGFTSLSSESTPMQVVDFLGDVYHCFDETLALYDTYKVDTVGDAYIVASGLPERNDGKHVIEIANAALHLRTRLAALKIAHKPDRKLEMRVGIHSGPCIAGIVGGLEMPKYCVFGDTLTLCKFMESNGMPMKIHITAESKALLEGVAGFRIEPRTPRINREGQPFQTYWLEKS